jgi:SAM-dependent methyltransferase
VKSQESSSKADFDEFSVDYDAALAHGLSVSGESKDYFARGRIAWVAKCLRQMHEHPRSIMDFGCGTGSAVPFMRDMVAPEFILGVDVSLKSLEVARQGCKSEGIRFLLFGEYQPEEKIDLIFCNGVFHHIPVGDRASKINYIYHSLRPGGLLAFWENNPWNPGTRYVMSRIPFDRNAVTLTPPEARRMLDAGGFEILRTDFLFIFPSMLGWFRGIEPLLSRMPFGAQYQVLCRKAFNRP